MADLTPYAYQGGQVKTRDLPEVPAGTQTTAEQFGAGRARDLHALAGAGLQAGLAMTDIATIKQNRVDAITERELRTRANDEYREHEKNVLLQKKGMDARDLDKEADAWWRAKQTELSERAKEIRNPRLRQGFSMHMEELRERSVDAMAKYSFGEVEQANRRSRLSENERYLREAETEDLLDSRKQEEKRLLRHVNIKANMAGEAQETIDLALREADREFHTRIANGHAAASLEHAISYLEREDVKKAFTPAERQTFYGKMSTRIQGEARKQAENQMRQLGIMLGEKYDKEIDVIRALAGIHDRELATIARTEAEIVRKARLLEKEAGVKTAEAVASENRLARKQAKAIIMGKEPDDPADDIEDEDALDLALEERGELTEHMREKIRKYALVEIKIRKTREAANRRKLDNDAVKTMAAAKWDVSAIDPEWPLDLQDRVLDQAIGRGEAAERREIRREKEARKAKALEYLEMPLDQLNEKILAGEYLDIVEDVGAGTPEFEKLKKRLDGEDAGGLTMLQLAKNEYTKIVGNPAKKKTDYAGFITKVDEARKRRTRDLKLDNPNMLPESEQKKIINDLLTDGDFRWFEWSGHLSPNQLRYQVADENLDKWKPYNTPTETDELPAFARPYVGPRDRRRQILPDGRVLIESASGSISIINQDGSIIDAELKGNT